MTNEPLSLQCTNCGEYAGSDIASEIERLNKEIERLRDEIAYIHHDGEAL
jgi:hypothetical protein